MFAGLRTWWRSTAEFPASQRRIFYDVMAAQLAAGVPAASGCETLSGTVTISAPMTRLAEGGVAAAREGRGVVAGFGDTGYLPMEDLGLLKVAERSASLGEAFRDLSAAGGDRLGIVSSVLAPNGYFLFVLALALAGASQLADVLSVAERLTDLSQNNAYRLSRWIEAYGPWALAVFGGVAGAMAVGRIRWIGSLRRVLLGLDGIYRAQVGIKFSVFAGRLYDRGAAHVEVLDAAAEAFGRSGFVGHGIARARADHAVAGMGIEDALAGRLLTAEAAAILKGLVPRGERGLYGRGFRAVAAIQTAVLRSRLTAVASAVRTVAIAGVGLLVAVVVPGIYEAFSVSPGQGGGF